MMSAGPLIGPALFAQLRIDWELTILCILLIALIVAGCMTVVCVRRWLREEAPPLSPDELLQSYQALVERGELDAREFERIKARMVQKAAEPPPTDAPTT